jgi:Cobalamin-5-phosphate synthase
MRFLAEVRRRTRCIRRSSCSSSARSASGPPGPRARDRGGRARPARGHRSGRSSPPAVAAAACARFTPIALAAALPYARPGEGQGGTLAGRTSPLQASLAAAAALAIAAAAARTDGLILFAAGCLLAIALGLCFHRWLAGVTGDTLGAATEITETLALVVAAGLMV